jgi:glucose/mannose transport system permease protein
MSALDAALTRRPRRLGGRRKARRRPLKRGDFAVVAALAALAVLVLVPVYVMVMAGFKPPSQADARHMWALPKTIDFSGFRGAWDALGPNFVNSLQIVIPATVISSLIGSVNGYVLAKMPFRGANFLFLAMLLGMFMPYQVILVPMVRFLQEIHLYGTTQGLILVHCIYGIPITTLIFRNYYGQIPSELVQAAHVDGASPRQVFTHVILPLSLPGFVVCGIFQFTNIWNDFLFGITVVPDPAKQPITVALNNLSGTFSVDWNVVMAGAVLAAIPTAIIYIALGRFYVRGLVAGALK